MPSRPARRRPRPHPDEPLHLVGVGGRRVRDAVLEAEQVARRARRPRRALEAVDPPARLHAAARVLGEVAQRVHDRVGVLRADLEAEVAAAVRRVEVVVREARHRRQLRRALVREPKRSSNSVAPKPSTKATCRAGSDGPRMPLSSGGDAGPRFAGSPPRWRSAHPGGDVRSRSRSSAFDVGGRRRTTTNAVAGVGSLRIAAWCGPSKDCELAPASAGAVARRRRRSGAGERARVRREERPHPGASRRARGSGGARSAASPLSVAARRSSDGAEVSSSSGISSSVSSRALDRCCRALALARSTATASGRHGPSAAGSDSSAAASCEACATRRRARPGSRPCRSSGAERVEREDRALRRSPTPSRGSCRCPRRSAPVSSNCSVFSRISCARSGEVARDPIVELRERPRTRPCTACVERGRRPVRAAPATGRARARTRAAGSRWNCGSRTPPREPGRAPVDRAVERCRTCRRRRRAARSRDGPAARACARRRGGPRARLRVSRVVSVRRCRKTGSTAIRYRSSASGSCSAASGAYGWAPATGRPETASTRDVLELPVRSRQRKKYRPGGSTTSSCAVVRGASMSSWP